MVTQLDEIREEIIEFCNDSYESCKDNNTYFIAENSDAYHVKEEIIHHLPPEHAKYKFVDSLAYILDIDGKVFINIA